MIALNHCAASIWGLSSHRRSGLRYTSASSCTDGIHLCNCTCPPRHGPQRAGVRVRLTRRLASYIDGVNLSAHGVGDVFEVTRHEAELLIAEEWAVPVVPRAHPLRSRTAARLSQ